MRFEKLVPGHTTNLKVGKTRQGKGPRTPPSVTVPLPAELRGELEAVAGQYGIPLARLAREALLIGLRAIKARSEAYNRRTLGGEITHKLKFEEIARAMGVPHIHTLKGGSTADDLEALLRQALAGNELTLIVVRNPCLLAAKRDSKRTKTQVAQE